MASITTSSRTISPSTIAPCGNGTDPKLAIVSVSPELSRKTAFSERSLKSKPNGRGLVLKREEESQDMCFDTFVLREICV
jgi:hypothetical protein